MFAAGVPPVSPKRGDAWSVSFGTGFVSFGIMHLLCLLIVRPTDLFFKVWWLCICLLQVRRLCSVLFRP